MTNTEKIMRLFDEASPAERADVLREIHARFVETTHAGVLSSEDFARVVAGANNLGDAAKQLGVCRRTLQYHMRLLGMPRGNHPAAMSTPSK